ncbi:uncharacterized protein LAESUDRAFT_814039 [Laetiporus sulphureus 93-53]|uniref:Protein kinase domain-containing protein n=1 Tax=Laetiporus sulphureus 93-53 TaxID=1314785 RepID=A0A165DED0_9APHY|nr:uncharacterized protein LAESUDRAFT_814039 [Laetiporus sulphureus 93-53]KZT04697.1 hypothetical protein LAESUDRAFT_814039 [Laetiporus sulphureus 93-53]
MSLSSSGSSPPKAEEAIDFIFEKMAKIRKGDFVLSPEHTRSLATRPPTIYDRHLPAYMRIKKLGLDEGMLISFHDAILRLVGSNDTCVKFLARDEQQSRHVIDLINHSIKGAFSSHLSNEESVADAMGKVFYDLFTLISAMLCNSVCREEGEPPPILTVVSSTRKTERADAIVEFVTSGESESLIPDKYRGLGALMTIEYKNVLAGNPRIYLSMIAMIAVLARSGRSFPSCSIDCDICQPFKFCHDHFAALTADGRMSQDGPSNVALPSEEQLRAAFQRVAEQISVYDKTYSPGVKRKKKHPKKIGANEGTEATKVFPTAATKDIEQLAELKSSIRDVCPSLGLTDESLLDDAEMFVSSAWETYIQMWSRLVTHNGTYELLTSGPMSSVLQRHREEQVAVMSDMFLLGSNLKSYLQDLTGLVITAIEDAVVRSSANGGERWRDPPLGVAKDGAKKRTHGGSDAEQPKQKRRRNDKDGMSEDNENDDADEGLNKADEDSNHDGDDNNGHDSHQNQHGDYDEQQKRMERQQWKLNAFEGVHLAFYGGGFRSTGFTHLVPIHSVGTGDTSTNVVSVGSNESGSSRSNSEILSSLHGTSTHASISHAANSDGASLSSGTIGRQDSIKEAPEDRTTLLDIESLQSAERRSDTATAGCLSVVNQVWGGHALIEPLGGETIEVALKIAIDEPSGLKLRQELDAYKILHHHPGIAPRCFGLYEDSTGTTILVLEHCGTALMDFDLDLVTREAIYHQVAELHKAGIVHDDLSPCNILLRENSTVRIADFETFWPGHVCPGPGCTDLQVLRCSLEL